MGGIMAASVRLMMERAALPAINRTSTTATSNVTSVFSQAAANRTDGGNATFDLISNLVFAESKSVRTSTIILASFNVLASFATASSILYDCYWASKRCNPKFKASKFCVRSIHPAETFPLILAIGIFIQGLVFAGVQGEGLESLFTKGCGTIAQFMFPALFIVPFLQVVFGLECAIRSLRATPFQARGSYDVTICLVVVALMLIVAWIPTHVLPEPDTCFASLLWFITRFGQLGFVLLASAGGLMIISTITIFTRLSSVTLVDQHQRIAASRMVYYLVLGMVSLAFVIPFFFSLIDHEGDIKLAMMATVVLNLSGLMSGLLQLFLRSNTQTTSFGPKAGRSWDNVKHDIRIFGPNELAMQAQLTNPVTGPRMQSTVSRSTSRASLIAPEKGRTMSIESFDSPKFPVGKGYVEMSSLPQKPEPTLDTTSPTSTRTHQRKQSYSLFPVEGSSPTRQQVESVYDISELEPPSPAWGRKHRRDSSIASSATVQIGLRLSHAPPTKQDMANLPPALPATTYTGPRFQDASTLGVPIPAPLSLPSTTYAALPATTFNALPATTYSAPAANSPPRSPLSTPSLKLQTSLPSSSNPPSPPARSPKRPIPSPLITSILRQAEPSPTKASSSSSSSSINKTLPPTPKAFLNNALENVRESNTQLSPAVYTPPKGPLTRSASDKRVVVNGLPSGPSPKSSPRNNPLRAHPLGSPLGFDRASPSASSASAQSEQKKQDWI